MPKIKPYLSDDMISNFNHWNRSYKSTRKNSAEFLTNGVIQPVVHSIHNRKMRSDCGVFHEDGRYVMGSNMWSAHEEMIGKVPKYMPVATGRWVWGGELFNHYGHFLTQSTARLYYYLQNQDKFDGIMFVWCWQFMPPKYMFEFLELAGVNLDKVRIVNQLLKVETLAVPTLASFNNFDWTDDFLLPFKNASDAVPAGTDSKIYMSRRKWKSNKAQVFGERDIERAFVKNGFKSICPETMTIGQQIAAVKGATEIAGIAGTALHNILFAAGMNESKRVIMLNRTEVFNIQFMINEMVGVDMDVIRAHHNFLPVSHADGPFIIGMTDELRAWFNDNKMDANGVKFRPEKYAKKFLAKYMEIYSIPAFYQDLRDQGGDKINASDLINIVRLARRTRLRPNRK